jgi:DNA-binding NtrC family response regulator
VGRALQLRQLRRENLALHRKLAASRASRPEAFRAIVTDDPAMLSIFRYVEAIAPSSQPVLITGETGVGKELVARAIHELSGRQGELVIVNVAGLEDQVFSDTLFGHVRGAFTGAERPRPGLIRKASGGTLVLDEIGDLTPASQVKLLRLAQNGEYLPLGQDEIQTSDARIVATTNRNLWDLQAQGSFRKDLHYRLRTHHIHLPPLRERPDDIPLLVDHFLEEAARSLDKPRPTPPPQLYDLLRGYSFPGNVRELKSLIFDAVSRHSGGKLSLQPFVEYLDKNSTCTTLASESHSGRYPAAQGPSADPGQAKVVFPGELPTIKEVVDLLVQEAMRRAGGKQSLAARMLGISPPALSKRLRK